MRMFAIALAVGVFLWSSPAAGLQPASPDADGFIRDWLVLAPIPLEGESGASEIDRDMLDGESTVKPRAGDAVTVGGKELRWTPHRTADYFIDFLASFGKARGEYVAGYAVAYVIAEEEAKVTLALSTNDQGKAWVNGRQVSKFAETRVLEKDADLTDVILTKGSNTLLLKVINEINNWQACARFLKDGAPVRNLRISTSPE